jgi:hypothetical protein
MFANARTSTTAVPLWTLALVMAAWAVTAGLMWNAYREGGSSQSDGCQQMVCRGADTTLRNG